MNKSKIKYIDSHAHWTDLRLYSRDDFNQLLDKSLNKQINLFLLAGVDPIEWQRQLELVKKFPDQFRTSFGLHPYFVAQNSEEDCEAALDQLSQLIPQAFALGETGLDFRPHIMKESQYRQIEMFENQIEIAKVYNKPMVLHLVQSHEKCLQIFDWWGNPNSVGFLHSFNASFEVAKKFIDRGFLISVSSAITHKKNTKILDCVKKIPLEFLLLESDCPDQKPSGWSLEEPNDSSCLCEIAEKIAFLRNKSAFEILEISSQNFKRLFRM